MKGLYTLESVVHYDDQNVLVDFVFEFKVYQILTSLLSTWRVMSSFYITKYEKSSSSLKSKVLEKPKPLNP